MNNDPTNLFRDVMMELYYYTTLNENYHYCAKTVHGDERGCEGDD